MSNTDEHTDTRPQHGEIWRLKKSPRKRVGVVTVVTPFYSELWIEQPGQAYLLWRSMNVFLRQYEKDPDQSPI